MESEIPRKKISFSQLHDSRIAVLLEEKNFSEYTAMVLVRIAGIFSTHERCFRVKKRFFGEQECIVEEIERPVEVTEKYSYEFINLDKNLRLALISLTKEHARLMKDARISEFIREKLHDIDNAEACRAEIAATLVECELPLRKVDFKVYSLRQPNGSVYEYSLTAGDGIMKIRQAYGSVKDVSWSLI